ncbi:MAG TPA: tyrosine-protein phosphatase [Thermomicrobiales bacterium]|nr:tyrosine-protein phosphatase [Thermomicrobiales bacterium]
MSALESPNRELTLEGSANFRDLGGLETRDGQVVRSATLFRSDALAYLTAADLDLLGAIGIASMIDLRTADELERYGLSPLREHGVRHIHLPLIERTGDPADFNRDLTLSDFYVRILEHAGDRVRRIFETLAEPSNLPSVVHCTGGKDRTGIAVALVLRLLNVPDAMIVADYAMTDRNMARLVESRRAAGQPISHVNVPEHFMRAVPETMEYFLVTLDNRWGSIHGYLDAIEIDVAVRDAVRSNLLAPAQAGT